LNHFHHGNIFTPNRMLIGSVERTQLLYRARPRSPSAYEVRDITGACVGRLLERQSPGSLFAVQDANGNEIARVATSRWLASTKPVLVRDVMIGSSSRFGDVTDTAGKQMLRVRRTSQRKRNEFTVTFTPMVSLPRRVLGYALAVERRNNTTTGA
jgi:hypothetical protein